MQSPSLIWRVETFKGFDDFYLILIGNFNLVALHGLFSWVIFGILRPVDKYSIWVIKYSHCFIFFLKSTNVNMLSSIVKVKVYFKKKYPIFLPNIIF